MEAATRRGLAQWPAQRTSWRFEALYVLLLFMPSTAGAD